MIGRLRGIVAYKAPPWLVVDVNGVGYELEAPMSTFYGLAGHGPRGPPAPPPYRLPFPVMSQSTPTCAPHAVTFSGFHPFVLPTSPPM